MTESKFQQLCNDVCELIKDKRADSLVSTGYLELRGIPHRIFFDEVLAPDTVVCLSELGIIGQEDREQKLETLLGMNLFSHSGFPIAFGIDPTREKAVCIRHFDGLASLSANELADHLNQMSDYACRLQQEIALAPTQTIPRDPQGINHAIA